MFHLPVPLSEQPPRVHDFARQGFATVIRLPLDRHGAVAEVHRQLSLLREGDAPLLLFLERIGRLELNEEGNGDSLHVELTRDAQSLTGQPTTSETELRIVDLGEQGRYLSASRSIKAEIVVEVLRKAIEAKEIDSTWLDWGEDAVVSVAVSLDTSVHDGRMYTYLPMEAPAPLAGHINAPFYAKLDRRGIDTDLSLNSLFLDEIAKTCVSAAREISERNDRAFSVSAVDLFAWDGTEEPRLASACQELGEDLSEVAVLPALSSGGTGWSSLDDTYLWDEEDRRVFTSQALAKSADVQLLDPSLGVQRLGRIEDLHRAALGTSMRPNAGEIGKWAETLAQHQLRKRKNAKWWNLFYDELAVLLLHEEGDELFGCRILLDEDRSLRMAGPPDDASTKTEPIVFFPPVRQRVKGLVDLDAADEIFIPKTLRRRFVFMHPDLKWLRSEGKQTRVQKASRRFLEDNNLVQPYGARALLEHVRDLLKHSRSKAVFRDTLRLAFRLHQTREYDQRPALRDLGLRVFAEDGWIRARKAHFSAAWPGTLGKRLEGLIKASAGTSSELNAMRGTLLAPPEGWPFDVEPGAWVDFLSKVGVRDGLVPAAEAKSLKFRGWDFRAEMPGSKLGLPTGLTEQWAASILSTGLAPGFSSGSYANATPVYLLPGQVDYARFPPRARDRYAELIAASASLWTDEHLTLQVRRTDVTYRNVDTMHWPTPAAAFLTAEQWVPMATPGARSEVRFVSLTDAWHFKGVTGDEGADYARPDYAPLLPRNFRSVIDARPRALERLKEQGLNVWNDPAHSDRLVAHMGALVASESVPEHHVANIRRAYDQAWSNSVEDGLGESAAEADHLVVSRGGTLGTFHRTIDAGETLYVEDGGSQLTRSVLDLSTRAVLAIAAHTGSRVAEVLGAKWGDQVVPTSNEQVVVLADGVEVTPGEETTRLLSAELEWLDKLVMAAIELKSSAFRRLTGSTRDRVLGILRSTKVRHARKVSIEIGGVVVAPPGSMWHAIPVPDETHPTLVVLDEEPISSWRRLEGVVPALADLLGYPELADCLGLAVTKLGRSDGTAAISPPSISSLAESLGKPEESVRDVVRALQGSVDTLIEELAPVIVLCVGLEEFKRLAGAVGDAESEAEVLSEFEARGVFADYPNFQAVLREARGVEEFRRGFGISLSALNGALRALDRSPIHYRDDHALAFSAYLAKRREDSLGRLRRAYLSDFRKGLSLERYLALRDDYFALAADPSWLDDHELPPDHLMRERVEEWSKAFEDPDDQSREVLAPLDETRRKNHQAINDLVGRAQCAILAWTAKEGVVADSTWGDADINQKVLDGVLEEGLCDFEELSESQMLVWLSSHELWQSGMPVSLDLLDLGLEVEDLEKASSKEEKERVERAFLLRSIEVGGVRYGAEPSLENYSKIASAARASIAGAILKTGGGFSVLSPPPPKGSRGRSGGKGKNAVKQSQTETQRGAIGLWGEVVALEWLKRRYKGASDDAWKSGYRDLVLGGTSGDDSLGYDFEVPSGQSSFLFEVKATTGDRMEIELGESEVAAAQRYARSKRYRIIYITFTLEPARQALHVLPNPFHEEGRGLYRVVGSGLRYRFSLGPE